MGSSSQHWGEPARLGDDWREALVTSKDLAEMLGCRPTHLQQNYGEALLPVRRGLWKLESVSRALAVLIERCEDTAETSDANVQRLRLRAEKLRADIAKTSGETADFTQRLRRLAADEMLDEFAELSDRLRDEVKQLPPPLVEAHNAFVRRVAALIEAKARSLESMEPPPP